MITKAIALLHRWLAHDAAHEHGEPDLTLDDETNDLLIAYGPERARHDQAVLDAMATVGEYELRFFAERAETEQLAPACAAELARRAHKAETARIRRELTAASPEVRARARAALAKLESLR